MMVGNGCGFVGVGDGGLVVILRGVEVTYITLHLNVNINVHKLWTLISINFE
jgi:hypothetical protein